MASLKVLRKLEQMFSSKIADRLNQGNVIFKFATSNGESVTVVCDGWKCGKKNDFDISFTNNSYIKGAQLSFDSKISDTSRFEKNTQTLGSSIIKTLNTMLSDLGATGDIAITAEKGNKVNIGVKIIGAK